MHIGKKLRKFCYSFIESYFLISSLVELWYSKFEAVIRNSTLKNTVHYSSNMNFN